MSSNESTVDQPSAQSRSASSPSSLLFADGPIRISRQGTRVRIEWGDAPARTLTPSSIDTPTTVRRVQIDEQSEGLLIGGLGHHFILVVHRAGNLTIARGGSLGGFSRWGGIFPGDGSIRTVEVRERPCRPSRADLERARRTLGPAVPLATVRARGIRWHQRRLRENRLQLQDGTLIWARPRWVWRGSWGACESRFLPAGAYVGHLDPPWSRTESRRVEDPHAMQLMTGRSEGTATLNLPRPRGRAFHLWVYPGRRQTRIDSVALSVGERVIRPRVCAREEAPAYCAQDGHTYPLGRDPLQLQFTLGDVSGPLRLVTSGTLASTGFVSGRAPAFDPTAAHEVFDDARLRVTIHEDARVPGRVRIRWGAAHTMAIDTSPWRSWRTADLDIRRVRLRGAVVALYVSASWPTGDDDGRSHWNVLLLRDGPSLTPVADGPEHRFATRFYGARFPGDGTVRIERPATRECHPTQADLERGRQLLSQDLSLEEVNSAFDAWVQTRRVERILRVTDGRFEHAAPRYRWLDPWSDCEGYLHAACPFVDVFRRGEFVRVGEILRAAQFVPSTQALALPPTEGRLVIRLSEEKPETTWLDAIWVDIGGQVVRPLACGHPDPPAYCEVDGRFFIMSQGDRIELDFGAPAARAQRAVAVGFYEPHPIECEAGRDETNTAEPSALPEEYPNPTRRHLASGQ